MTIYDFLKTALLPLGKTLYVCGGGWEKAEGYVGVNPLWEQFFREQDASYDFHQYRDRYELGLDCSGYVGWCLSNLFCPGKGARGYVKKASTQAKYFSSLGFGEYIPKCRVRGHRPGDIMSTEGVEESHVYISLGECPDQSLLLLHSTANGGVQLNGTAGEAEKIAGRYMERYFPEWDQRYHGKYRKPEDYKRDYGQMRWNVCGGGTLKDPEGVRFMRPEEVLKLLFRECEREGLPKERMAYTKVTSGGCWEYPDE